MHDDRPRVVYTSSGRRVGYRRLGRGRPAVLLHASPRSAVALLPLGHRLADRFEVFAFDTPGFGWSDALALPRPDAADFADALLEAWDALGIARAPLYGSHTGAAIAVAAGQRHPDRVSALVLDGYAMFTATEQAEYLANYLAPLAPSWDGSHLAFLWSRVKDQFTFFPWYLRCAAARIARPLPPLAFMQAVVVDFLAAGDDYRTAYAAAFRFDGGPELRRLTVPTTVLARSDDLLFGHLDMLGEQPTCVRAQKLGEDHGAWADAIAAALHGPTAEVAPESGVVVDLARPGRGCLTAVRVAGGVIGVTCHGSATASRPVVLLPGIPGSALGEVALARALAASRPVLAVDLPGFGVSSLDNAPDAAAIAAAIRAALAALGAGDFDVLACAESAAIGVALDGAAVLLDPVPDEARAGLLAAMVDASPRRDGTHLLAAWHQLRDAAQWRPWTATDPAHSIACGHDPDVARVQAVLTDWMRGGLEGRATLAAALAHPLGARARIIGAADHPWSRAHLAAGTTVREVQPSVRAKAAAILALIDGTA